MQDMAWCQAYAFQNRKHMLDLMVDSVNAITGALPDLKNSVNIHHNYCQCERCEYTVSKLRVGSKQLIASGESIMPVNGWGALQAGSRHVHMYVHVHGI